VGKKAASNQRSQLFPVYTSNFSGKEAGVEPIEAHGAARRQTP